MRFAMTFLAAGLAAAPAAALNVGPEVSVQLETEAGSGQIRQNGDEEALQDDAGNDRTWIRSDWPADQDFSFDEENQFVLDTVESSDGTLLGEVVEAGEAPGGEIRLFVDVADEISDVEERAVVTVPGPQAQSDGRITLPLTTDQFMSELTRAGD